MRWPRSAANAMSRAKSPSSSPWPSILLEDFGRLLGVKCETAATDPKKGRGELSVLQWPYPAATMLACTASSASFAGYPEVIAPSKKSPTAPLLLSPPVPRMMAPSFFIGS